MPPVVADTARCGEQIHNRTRLGSRLGRHLEISCVRVFMARSKCMSAARPKALFFFELRPHLPHAKRQPCLHRCPLPGRGQPGLGRNPCLECFNQFFATARGALEVCRAAPHEESTFQCCPATPLQRSNLPYRIIADFASLRLRSLCFTIRTFIRINLTRMPDFRHALRIYALQPKKRPVPLF